MRRHSESNSIISLPTNGHGTYCLAFNWKLLLTGLLHSAVHIAGVVAEKPTTSSFAKVSNQVNFQLLYVPTRVLTNTLGA